MQESAVPYHNAARGVLIEAWSALLWLSLLRASFKYRYVVGVTTGCGHLPDQQSSVESLSIKGSRGASRQDQAIKSQF